MVEYSDISRKDRQMCSKIWQQQEEQQQQAKLTSAKRTAYVLHLNIDGFVQHFGIEHCGFLTLTFPDDVTEVQEASRRFNSMRTNFLNKHVLGYIGVYERTKRGVIHFHFIAAFKENISQGFDFAAIKSGIYNNKTRNPAIAIIWKLFRDNLPIYGFGRHELVPIKSKDGMARYLAKYLTKGVITRNIEDKGFRFVRSSSDKGRWWKRATSRFAWHSPSAIEWRKALRHWVEDKADTIKELFFARTGLQITLNEDTYSQVFKIMFSHKWCYNSRSSIILNYQQLKERSDDERTSLFDWRTAHS